MRPRNLNSSTYSTTSWLIRNWGSNTRPGRFEKCIALDLEVEKVNPLRLVHWRTLFMQLCIFSSMMWRSLCLYDICRSSTNNEEWNLGSGGIWLTIWFILIVKRVTESTDPWDTPSSLGYKSERWLFTCTRKVLLLKNSLMYCGSPPLSPKSWRSRDTILPCCIICFLKIEENADNMLIVHKSLSDTGLKSHQVVSCGSAAPPSTLHTSEVAEHVAVVVETVVD